LFPVGVDYGPSGKSVKVDEILPMLFGEYKCINYSNVYNHKLDGVFLKRLINTKTAKIILQSNYFSFIQTNQEFIADNPKYYCYNLAYNDPVSIWEFPLAHRADYFHPNEWRERIFYVIVSNCVTNPDGTVNYWDREWHFEIQTNGQLISLDSHFVFVWEKINTNGVTNGNFEKSWWQFWK